ncbi:hypothetical protein LP419_05380 [Massilia sp. H-1]|nr:hypothetical protein LP419_05380 [Massilia sp. H-1]
MEENTIIGLEAPTAKLSEADALAERKARLLRQGDFYRIGIVRAKAKHPAGRAARGAVSLGPGARHLGRAHAGRQPAAPDRHQRGHHRPLRAGHPRFPAAAPVAQARAGRGGGAGRGGLLCAAPARKGSLM